MIVKKGIENADCKIKSEDELMNKSDFNLIEEQWIPVAQIGLVSLRDIFSNPDLPALGGSVLEKIAVMKLLLAIAQTAYTPRDNKDWLELGISGLKEKCLSYLEQQKPYFSLYGEYPFLQFTQVKKAEIKPYSILFPEIASGNTSLLFHSQVAPAITDLDDAKKALALLVQMSSCFSGKKVDASVVLSPGYVKSKSAKSGPALCSLGLLHSFFTGENILDTIWFNLLTSQDISHDRTFINGIGTPPWEKMPAGEDDEIAQSLKHSLMGRLVPMARFVLLDNGGVHFVEGIQHDDYLHGGVVDPSVTADVSKAKAKVIWADPAKRPWRSLTAMLGFLDNEGTYVCQQLKWCLPRIESSSVDTFGIWSGGIRLSNKAGEQYLTGDDDVVESEISFESSWFKDGSKRLWLDFVKSAMKELEKIAQTVYAAVRGYYDEAKLDKAGEFAQHAVQDFWLEAEGFSQKLLSACASKANAQNGHNQKGDEDYKKVLNSLRIRAKNCYVNACPDDTARQLEIFVRHFPHLGFEKSAAV